MIRVPRHILAAALVTAVALPLAASAGSPLPLRPSTPLLVALQQPAGPAKVAQPDQRAGDGFEPVSNLPDPGREQLPAAPMVMAAYAVVWVMVLGYLWSIWRRLGTVERELKSVAARIEEAGRR